MTLSLEPLGPLDVRAAVEQALEYLEPLPDLTEAQEAALMIDLDIAWSQGDRSAADTARGFGLRRR